jgi:hypothetical protein
MHVRSRANDDLFAAPVDPCKPSFGLSGVREPYLNQSHTCITASIARANPSKTSANESKTSLRQVTCLQSSGPITRVNESMASVIDALTSVSQLTCHERSACYPVGHHHSTRAESIKPPQKGGGGVGGCARCRMPCSLSPIPGGLPRRPS